MKLISKLNNDYPVADPASWLSGDWTELDLIFAGRIAALAKSAGRRLLVTSGYRDTKEQARLYQAYLYYKRTGKGNIKSAAKPGASSHNYMIAADISTQPIRGMNNSQLKKWGLCKPISSEGWHVQPIETQYERDFSKWEPREEEEVETDKITVKMNGKSTELTTILYKNENYMKIRDLGDAQKDDDLTVDWDAKNKTVIINSK